MSDKSHDSVAVAAVLTSDDVAIMFSALLVIATERVRVGGFGKRAGMSDAEDVRVFNRVVAVMDKLAQLLGSRPARVTILAALLEDTDLTPAEKANVKRFAETVRDELTTKPALPSDADAARN